jgi:hypothetical protein
MRQGTNLKVGTIKITCPGKVGKGLAVRLALMAYLEWIHETRNPGGRSHSFVVMIDGTGSYVGQLSTVLKYLGQSPIVLGHRQNASGMNDPRTQIEAFESYLLEQRHGCHLPDYQAGAWGFRIDMLQHLPLTASGYGLEYDLASCVVERGLPHVFAPVFVNVDGRSPSSFPDEASEEKLRFIMAKLGWSLADVERLYRQYKTTAPLPHGYCSMIEDFFAERAFQTDLGSPRL